MIFLRTGVHGLVVYIYNAKITGPLQRFKYFYTPFIFCYLIKTEVSGIL